MPLHLTIDPARRIIVSAGEGSISDADLKAGREKLTADPRFDPTFDRIWDLSAATRLTFSDEALQQFAEKSLSGVKVRRAIVCVAPEIVSRVLEFVEESRRFHRDIVIFPTRQEAEEWIASPRE